MKFTEMVKDVLAGRFIHQKDEYFKRCTRWKRMNTLKDVLAGRFIHQKDKYFESCPRWTDGFGLPTKVINQTLKVVLSGQNGFGSPNQV